MQKLNDIFEQLNIKTDIYNHKSVFSLQEAKHLESIIPGAACKSLFLQDDNGVLWMLVAVGHEKVPMKEVAKKVNAPGLRFASAELMLKHLGVTPGSVSPFALINDVNHEIIVLLDDKLFGYDLAGFHPMDNSKTITISPKDLIKFISLCTNKHHLIHF